VNGINDYHTEIRALLSEVRNLKSELAEKDRRIAELEAGWKCFHCGRVFAGAEASEHFGHRNDAKSAACEAMLCAIAETFEQYGVHRNFHNAASVKILADMKEAEITRLTTELAEANRKLELRKNK
jgi:cell division septum initiation protein DivIVA